MEIGLAFGIAGAAVATFLAGSGSAIGIGITGRTAAGLLTEEPEKFGNIFLLVFLPGTQGFYGFIVGLLVILKLGLLGDTRVMPTMEQGLQLFFACLPIGIAGLVSAIHQGKVCAGGIEMASKQPGSIMKILIYGVMVETYAVLGFLISLLIVMLGVKLG